MARAQDSVFRARCVRAQGMMAEHHLHYLLVALSSDLLYLTGYFGLPSERPTIMVLPVEGRATMIMPAFELVRLDQEGHEVFYDVAPWSETGDPYALVRKVVGNGRATVAVSDQMWARFLLGIQDALPNGRFVSASPVLESLRMVKDATEIATLMELGGLMDVVFEKLRAIPFDGRTEIELGDDIFQIVKSVGLSPTRAGGVASGPNSASPHHSSGHRRIRHGDALWVELGQGGHLRGYRADKTRCFFVGHQTERYRTVYSVAQQAQEAAFQAVRPGVTCHAVDRAGRAVIEEAGYGAHFPHRLGHGLGLDSHEQPYIVEGSGTVLRPGMVFSDEPGIYVLGEFGIRIEDIVVVTDSGAQRIYKSTHMCVEVE